MTGELACVEGSAACALEPARRVRAIPRASGGSRICTSCPRVPSQLPARAVRSCTLTAMLCTDFPAFLNPTWRNTIIAFAAGYLIYSFAPSPVKGSASPSVSNDNVVAESKDQSVPFITRWLAGQMAGDGELWKKRSDKHLELASEVADTRLLFQEAERPKILRMKYPS